MQAGQSADFLPAEPPYHCAILGFHVPRLSRGEMGGTQGWPCISPLFPSAELPFWLISQMWRRQVQLKHFSVPLLPIKTVKNLSFQEKFSFAKLAR